MRSTSSRPDIITNNIGPVVDSTYMMYIALLLILSNDIVNGEGFDDCRTGENGSVEIVNVTTAVIISRANQTNASAYLTYEYEWDIVNKEGIQFDGFLYKLEATTSLYSDLEDYDYATDVRTCNVTSTNELWATSEKGTSVRCQMPCTRYFPEFPSKCHESDSVCTLRNERGFRPLHKGQRTVLVAADFGEKYVFKLYAYQHWAIISEYKHDEITIFCKDELITKRGFAETEASKHCRNVSTASNPTLISGPVANFYGDSVRYDMSSNTAEAMFRWNEPYDISPSSPPIKEYAVSVSQGHCEMSFIEAAGGANDSYFNVTISEIQIGRPNTIFVTPTNPEGQRGVLYAHEFTIPEINACRDPYRYCHWFADCVDHAGDNETVAECSCKPGYDGNGINSSFSTGDGCTDFDACIALLEVAVCDDNAKCVDNPPPSKTAMCVCGSGFFGDGKRKGSGCRKISSIVLPALGVPMGLLSLFTIYCCVKRLRHIKTGRKKFSKFFASTGTRYTCPLEYDVQNQSNTAGVFGATYELRRDAIERKGVLGRGNFGVVYNGALKTERGTVPVAIKTMAEPRNRETEMEFLAEIALIISIGKHESVLGLIGCCTSGPNPPYLVTQYMKYGDLLHFLWDCREESNRARQQIYIFTEGNIYYIAMQVASGLEYVTGLRIIHGDIAARNILVDQGLKCKISDFGLANDVYRYGMVKNAREKKVPMRWTSPERMQAGMVPITWRSDVWSFGILLYEMTTLGANPFSEIPIHNLFEKLSSGYRMERPSSCSPFLYDIMTKCWDWVPSKRPTFKELKQIMQNAKTYTGENYEDIISPVVT